MMTAVGLWAWEPMTARDWGWMACLCLTGATGHWLLIKCYEVAEASAVQPFAYLQFVFVAIIGLTVFNEVLRTNVALGAALIVAAGLFAWWRERLVR
jgi:drug/metabolite transporter (DMT)-like permease